MINQIESFPKVKQHNAGSRTISVVFLVQVCNMEMRACVVQDLGTVQTVSYRSFPSLLASDNGSQRNLPPVWTKLV